VRDKLILATLGACLAACAADNSDRIDRETLYGGKIQETGTMAGSDPVFAAALTARFPAGTQLSALTAYIESLNGKCPEDRRSGRVVVCSIVESSTFCVRGDLLITAPTDGVKVIGPVQVQHYITGC